MNTAHIENYNGSPAIMIDGKPYPPMMATIRTIDNDKICFDRDYFSNLGKSGVRIFFLICDTEWLKPGAVALFNEEATALLREIPDAYIIPRIGLHPPNSWIESHPDDVVTFSDGSKPSVDLFTESYCTKLPSLYSLCSENWRHDAGIALSETWKMLMALPYADRIIGCFFAAGGTSEWYYIIPPVDMAKGISGDYSKSFRTQFSKYLREKYKSDEALQAAWHNDSATLDNPPIPSFEKHFFAHSVDFGVASPPKMRANAKTPPVPTNGTNIGSFIDIEKNPDIHDFYRAWHQGTADSILYFAKIIKGFSRNNLTGAFYGSHGCCHFLKDGTCGGTVKLLESDDIDFLAAPNVYENSHPSEFAGTREMTDSFRLANKIFINEEDNRTHCENAYFQNRYDMFDIFDSLSLMKRNFGRYICDDMQAWWFDQILGGGRYKHPDIYRLISRQQEIAHFAYEKDRRKHNEIAFIYDEESIQLVSHQTTRDLIEMHRNYELGHIGASVDQYYHNDMAKDEMPSYKLYVFFNLFSLSDAERKVITEKLKKDKAIAVWVYASGIVNPDKQQKLSADYISELTGIKIEMLDELWNSKFRINGEPHKLTEGLDKRYLYGYFDRRRTFGINSMPASSNDETYVAPVFYSNDEKAKVLAYFLGNKLPAMTVKEQDGYTSIFYGAKAIRSDLFRAFAKYAGCHIYCDSDDVLFANKNFLTFHATTSGTKTIRFPNAVDAYEPYEKKYYGKNVSEITFDISLGDTRFFSLCGEC